VHGVNIHSINDYTQCLGTIAVRPVTSGRDPVADKSPSLARFV